MLTAPRKWACLFNNLYLKKIMHKAHEKDIGITYRFPTYLFYEMIC